MNFTKKQLKYLKEIFTIPCCHITGTHDPGHYSERKYICTSQKSKALERGCKKLGINPETKSDKNCFWCYLYEDKKVTQRERKGEGLKLFKKKSKIKSNLEEEQAKYGTDYDDYIESKIAEEREG